MQLRKTELFAALALLWAAGIPGAPTRAESDPREEAPQASFRTPARRYGAAYSVKAELVRDGFHYVIPVWIRPDQRESTLDPGQMRFTGWNLKDFRAEELLLSGHSLGAVEFKPARSDWAVKPEYPKNCCMGVIGQDLLARFRVRFDPRPPGHIEWLALSPQSVRTRAGRESFEDRLKPLFTTRSEVIQIGPRRYNMSSTPFVLDVSEQSLVFEGATNGSARQTRKTPLFEYDFIGNTREIGVLSLGASGSGEARRLGFEPGVRVRELNGVPVSGMTRAEVDSYLRGRKGATLDIGFLKKSQEGKSSRLIFDFEKNRFTPAQ